MSNILKYNEAKFKLIQYLTSQDLGVGDKLPPEKELVLRIGLGMAPIRHALNELAELGVIRKVNGVGSFLSKKLDRPAQPECMLGVISVASVNEVAAAVHEKMKRHNGTYRIFYVGETPDDVTLRDIRSCDHFILIGYVNDLWINLVKGLGKPVVQIGRSPRTTEKITTLDLDYAAAIGGGIAAMAERGCKRFGLVAASPDFLAYSRMMADIFLEEMENRGLEATCQDVYLPSQKKEFADMRRFAASQQEEYDVLFVEFSILWTFAMHVWNTPHLRTKHVILIENSGRLQQDFDALDGWGVIRFKDRLFDKALKMLYDEPVNQIERNEICLSEPYFCGSVFK